MKARPILFQGAMVRALLDGRKTQTRRICKSQPYSNGHGWDGNDIICHNDYLPPSAMLMDAGGKAMYTTSNFEGWESECPYGQPGDQLWVRETHRPIIGQTCGLIAVDYKADPQEKWERMRDQGGKSKWTPSIHMKREYSRIQLEIVSVRVELLNDCSEADAKAEGVDPATCVHEYYDGYSKLWESINGAGSWAANPWVWVIEFKRVNP